MPSIALCSDAEYEALAAVAGHDGKPLAIVHAHDSSLNGKLLVLDTRVPSTRYDASHKEPERPAFVGYRPDDAFVKRVKTVLKLTKSEAMRTALELHGAVLKGYRPDDDDDEAEATLSRELAMLLRGPVKEGTIRLPPGAWFEPVPSLDPEQRDAIYVAGAAGSGKSWWVSSFLRQFHRLYPERKVYIVNKGDAADDKAYASLPAGAKPLQITAESLLLSPPDVTKDFGGPCCIVFDDAIDSFTGATQKAVQAFLADCLNLGRKAGVTVLATNHLLTDHSRTRATLNECQSAVIFANHCSAHSLNYFLAKMGIPLTPAELRTRGRWAQVSTRSCCWVLSEGECTLC
ncbi:MAG: hypothetical protein Q7U97_13000 [Rhodocyclaceae bacterium]|nr:hypothetical protein [Rhodocyclaceae bacterium]